jgi:hypothetical protein
MRPSNCLLFFFFKCAWSFQGLPIHSPNCIFKLVKVRQKKKTSTYQVYNKRSVCTTLLFSIDLSWHWLKSNIKTYISVHFWSSIVIEVENFSKNNAYLTNMIRRATRVYVYGLGRHICHAVDTCLFCCCCCGCCKRASFFRKPDWVNLIFLSPISTSHCYDPEEKPWLVLFFQKFSQGIHATRKSKFTRHAVVLRFW